MLSSGQNQPDPMRKIPKHAVEQLAIQSFLFQELCKIAELF